MPAGASSSTSATSPPATTQAGELSAEQVAGYIAKYATKATESFGAGLDRRLTDADDLDHLDQLPGACGRARPGGLGAGRPPRAGEAAAAGVGAHARVRRPLVDQEPPLLHHLHAPCAGPGWPSPSAAGPATASPWTPGAGPEDDQAVIVVAAWVYVGAGYETEGERWLALSAAARARERRRIAREELTTTTMIAA